MTDKRIIVSLMCLAVFLSCMGKPLIRFNEKGHDFGDLNQEISEKHVFTFKNAGTGVLKIIKIKSG